MAGASSREPDTRVRYLRLTGLGDTALLAAMSDRASDFQALLDAAGPGGMDDFAGQLLELRRYATLLTPVAATARGNTIKVPE